MTTISAQYSFQQRQDQVEVEKKNRTHAKQNSNLTFTIRRVSRKAFDISMQSLQ